MVVSRKPSQLRVPVQERARKRRESILDATARLLDRGGYDALTTNAVAREAKTAIGTVYEYFDSREALLAGVLERQAVRLGEAIDAAIVRGGEDLLAVADQVVDAFARVWRTEPGYRAAWSSAQVTDLLLRTGNEWGDTFTERIADLIGRLVPLTRRQDVRVVARTAVHLVSGLLLVAMSSPPATSRAMVAETKIALRAYLTTRLFGRQPRPLLVTLGAMSSGTHRRRSSSALPSPSGRREIPTPVLPTRGLTSTRRTKPVR